MKETVLLTGGAGFIGSHIAVELLQRDYDVVIADDLSNSSPDVPERIEKITGRAPVFYRMDVSDRQALDRVFRAHDIAAAVHLAGYKAVGESVQKPLAYYRNNLDTTLALLEVMADHGVHRLIFSSSATVYGNAEAPVGGFVRDRLLGRENTDVDIEVHGLTPQQLEEILDGLGGRLEMGASFGIYGLKGYGLDIAMPRRERAIGRGHRDFDVTVDPFLGTEQAARRRDFTINALMEDVLTGRVLDHFHGVRDLRRGVLRHVDDRTFPEDPLRVLRGAQFAARFGFTAAPETIALCRGIDLSALPPERVEGELRKALLQAERPSLFFETLRDMGQLSHWFPEVEALMGVPQEPRFHREGDVWTHTMLVLDQAAALRSRARQPFPFMLAALCHDLGKPAATEYVRGRIHAYDHESAGVPLADALVRRIVGEKAAAAYVRNMVQLHMKPNALVGADASVKASNRMFDQSLEPEDLILLASADGRGTHSLWPWEDTEPWLRQRLALYRELMARPQVTGADLIAAGLTPDSRFRELLAYAHKLHLAAVTHDSALKQTLAYARKLKQPGVTEN